jgi:hypothetical protein
MLGCGVDQAHLHVVIDAPFSFETFISKAKSLSALEWERHASHDPYSVIRPNRSYLLASSNGASCITQQVEGVGSQFFRRVIAHLIAMPEEWDYKSHAHPANVQRTVSAFQLSTE